MQRLLVIAGPTASGKTSLGVRLAERLGAEIVSADSVQLYRRLDIGSARPTPDEQRGVRHHLLDYVNLDEHYDASRFMHDADAAIADIRARGRIPLVVGGAGLYIRALVRGLAPGIPSDTKFRARLHERIEKGGREAIALLHAELVAVDPEYAAKVEPGDPIRVVRALEVYHTTGIAYSAHHRRHSMQPPRYDAKIYGLEVARDVLRERIRARTREMLARGWVDEVKGILADGYDPTLKPLRSVGYAEVVGRLLGTIPDGDLEASVVQSTAAFAKRQRTWFRGEPGVIWKSPDALGDESLLREIDDFLGASREESSEHGG